MNAFLQVLQVSPCREPQVHDCLDPSHAACTQLSRSGKQQQYDGHTHRDTHAHKHNTDNDWQELSDKVFYWTAADESCEQVLIPEH